VQRTYGLPGYDWAQCCRDAEQRYALPANIWNGLAARVDPQTDELVQTVDSGFTAPFRSLAGIAALVDNQTICTCDTQVAGPYRSMINSNI